MLYKSLWTSYLPGTPTRSSEISDVFKIKCFKYLMAFSCLIEFCRIEFKLELIYVDHSRKLVL